MNVYVDGVCVHTVWKLQTNWENILRNTHTHTHIYDEYRYFFSERKSYHHRSLHRRRRGLRTFFFIICCVVCAKMNGKKNNNKKDLKLTKLSVFFLTISSMYVVLARRVVSVFQFFFLFLLFSPVFFVRFIWKSQSFRSFFFIFLSLVAFFLKALVHHQTHTHTYTRSVYDDDDHSIVEYSKFNECQSFFFVDSVCFVG